ncbi:MAG: crossover junction endodeoxyribonuclease RuvC [Flavisolibacter sp.]
MLILGYSILEVDNNVLTVKLIDVLKLSSKKDNYERLRQIHMKITEVVETFSPNACAIEAPFFGKNVQSMLKLGRAQGVAIAAAMVREIPVSEYSPRKVKQSITGNGNADKEQVWLMLQRITGLSAKPKYFDASDALAVAVCHHFGNRDASIKKTQSSQITKSGWKQFAQQNPGRIS